MVIHQPGAAVMPKSHSLTHKGDLPARTEEASFPRHEQQGADMTRRPFIQRFISFRLYYSLTSEYSLISAQRRVLQLILTYIPYLRRHSKYGQRGRDGRAPFLHLFILFLPPAISSYDPAPA
jgi:hypothetical protein